jgi:hypothetical protein
VHHLSTSFVFGYHGCDRAIGERLLAGKTKFLKSENDYDWLGPGVYFWETNPMRALEFAQEKRSRHDNVKEAFVVGAVLDLGLCLDLTTKDSIDDLKTAYSSLEETFQIRGARLPQNGKKPWMRFLDCAVVRRLHEIVEDTGSSPIDSVRGIFQEGKPIYPGSAFLEKTHIQIAVMNLGCIKAVFRIED